MMIMCAHSGEIFSVERLLHTGASGGGVVVRAPAAANGDGSGGGAGGGEEPIYLEWSLCYAGFVFMQETLLLNLRRSKVESSVPI